MPGMQREASQAQVRRDLPGEAAGGGQEIDADGFGRPGGSGRWGHRQRYTTIEITEIVRG